MQERYSGIKNDANLNQELIDDAISYGTPTSIAWYENTWLKRTRQLYSGEWRKAIDLSTLQKFNKSFKTKTSYKKLWTS